MGDIVPTFHGELQLAGWSESHNSGCKVTFWLQSSEDLEAFRALTVRKGNQAGHRFVAALVEIGDDEQPIQRAPEPEKTEDGYGKHYAVLYKSGWFHNPKVVEAFDLGREMEPAVRVETIKQSIYAEFEVDSLVAIHPETFIEYLDGLGIRSTLPAAFGAA